MPGVSSMNIFVSDNVPIVSARRPHSSLVKWPVRKRCASICGLGAKHTRDELLLRHFEREDGDDRLFLNRRILSEGQA